MSIMSLSHLLACYGVLCWFNFRYFRGYVEWFFFYDWLWFITYKILQICVILCKHIIVGTFLCLFQCSWKCYKLIWFECSFFYTVHKKPLREVEIAAICQDALQVSMLHQQSGIIKIAQIFVHCFVYLGH